MKRAATALVPLAMLLAGPAAADAAKCVPHLPPPGRTRIVDTPPPTALLDRMAVLRRPQTEEDRAVLDRREHLLELTTLSARYTRYLGSGPQGSAYYLIVGTMSQATLPRRCLRNVSAKRRRREAKLRRRSREVRIGTVLRLAEGGGGSSFGIDARGLVRNLAVGTSSFGRHPALAEGLVPDGVATVDLTFSNGTSQTVAVQSNLWVAEVAGLGAERAFPTATVWKAPDGTTIKAFRDENA